MHVSTPNIQAVLDTADQIIAPKFDAVRKRNTIVRFVWKSVFGERSVSEQYYVSTVRHTC